jgi:DNA primase
MGKVNPVSAKYIIRASIETDGTVDRPDVIGAIFGQTEGFLGSDLELRELQRSGKIGRIEVKLVSKDGKGKGEIIIPSSLDKAETAIIGAALETIERIGPCNSHVAILALEDVRSSKRDFVLNRAKELLKKFESDVMPDSTELTQEVAQSVRMMDISTWGPEKLPAGPAVSESEEIILVEGRADVINLLKQGIKNTVAMNGTSVPESIKGLCKAKTVTVFVDGDRGGDIIIRDLMTTAEIDFVVKAPDGKEVEELTKKEVHIALRAKVAAGQYKADSNSKPAGKTYQKREERKPYQRDDRKPYQRREERRPYQRDDRPARTPRMNKELETKFKSMLEDLVGTRGAYLLDKDLNILGKVPTAELANTLGAMDEAFAVIFDGLHTKEITASAEKGGTQYLVGMKARVKPISSKVKILTQADLK